MPRYRNESRVFVHIIGTSLCDYGSRLSKSLELSKCDTATSAAAAECMAYHLFARLILHAMSALEDSVEPDDQEAVPKNQDADDLQYVADLVSIYPALVTRKAHN